MSDTPKRPRKVKTPNVNNSAEYDPRVATLGATVDAAFERFNQVCTELGNSINEVVSTLQLNTLYYAVGNFSDNALLICPSDEDLYLTWFYVHEGDGFRTSRRYIVYGGVRELEVDDPDDNIPPPPRSLAELRQNRVGASHFANGLPTSDFTVMHLLSLAGQNQWRSAPITL